MAGYVSDDYKATQNLTLNVGVRYEYDEPWNESNNKTGNVDEATGQVLYAGHVPVGAPQAREYAAIMPVMTRISADHAACRLCVSGQ